MGDSEINETGDHILSLKDDNSNMCVYIAFAQKLLAEFLGTYFLIFAGCGSVAVNLNFDKVVTFPGICITWGLVVMVLIYTVGHISGAHFNPAVTIAFASASRFPLRQVPAYIVAQVLGSTLASGTLRLMFTGKEDHFLGTMPAGSNMQSFVIEFIITFYLLFAVSGVATDDRAIGQLAGIAIGATVLLNVLVAGPISGASMNPARSLGPAIVWGHFKGIWIYLISPTLGAISGVWAYNLIRFTPKPVKVITKTKSFLKTPPQK
ncbi:aquaporin NIP1-2-like [Humulus lupulus]|uniref:aquaporin NIP1-2-like n=1 Tax=Humulus lupulus TaxID=3486 RepID=UPI002B40A6ED|nr:aquaporin NIP1-2-like [Humulus lupulus]